MSLHERTTAVGVFASRAQAEVAVDALARAGFAADRIGVVSRGDDSADRLTDTVAAGVITGGAAGALAGIGLAAMTLPIVGPVVVGGILAALLGSSVGAAAGGLLGALIGMGIPEEEAAYYESEFRAGRTIVTVRADERYSEAADILRRTGALDVTERHPPATAAMMGPP